MSQFTSSLPGIGATPITMSPRNTHIMPLTSGVDILPAGKIVNGAATRDPGNSADNVAVLRPGLLLGKVTTAPATTNSVTPTIGLLAASVIGVTTGALANGGTSITVSAAQATEIVRRIGTTGTFTLTGPPTAGGTVRTRTATFSAIVQSTGVITLTTLSVNEVQTVNFNIAATGGTFTLRVPKADGTLATTTPSSWSATDATFLSNLQTVLDAATGVTNGIVASAIAATDTDLGFVLTFSGTGYAGLPQPVVEVLTLPTSTTATNVVRTTVGVDGRFVAGSFLGVGDGSEVPVTFLAGDFPIRTTDINGNSIDVPNANIPITTKPVYTTNIVNYPTDTGLIAWVKSKLRVAVPGMSFDDDF